MRGYDGRSWAPNAEVFNPSFDVTPVELITSLVLDHGVIGLEALRQGGLRKS